MRKSTKISLVDYTLEEIFKDFVIFEGDKLIIKNCITPSFIYSIEKITGKTLNAVYRAVDETCPYCNHKLNYCLINILTILSLKHLIKLKHFIFY